MGDWCSGNYLCLNYVLGFNNGSWFLSVYSWFFKINVIFNIFWILIYEVGVVISLICLFMIIGREVNSWVDYEV